MLRLFAICDGCGFQSDDRDYPVQWPSYQPEGGAEALRFCAQDCMLLHLGAPKWQPRHRRLGINDAELRTLRLVALGHTNAEIGVMEGKAESTIKNRLSVLYAKLGGVEDRTQALLVAHARGLLNVNLLAEEFMACRRRPLLDSIRRHNVA